MWLLSFFVFCLQDDLLKNKITSELEIRTQHLRKGQYFRGSPKYRDEFWRDWALIDWGDETIPGQIWCFVVVEGVDAAAGVPMYHGGIEVKDGTYAVVESAPTSTDLVDIEMSDLFMPIEKEVEVVGTQNRAWRRRFYLADVEALHEPIAVVPNIGAKSKRSFFMVTQRYRWVEIFKAWLVLELGLNRPVRRPDPVQPELRAIGLAPTAKSSLLLNNLT